MHGMTFLYHGNIYMSQFDVQVSVEDGLPERVCLNCKFRLEMLHGEQHKRYTRKRFKN